MASSLHCDIVSVKEAIYSGSVQMLIARSVGGDVGRCWLSSKNTLNHSVTITEPVSQCSLVANITMPFGGRDVEMVKLWQPYSKFENNGGVDFRLILNLYLIVGFVPALLHEKFWDSVLFGDTLILENETGDKLLNAFKLSMILKDASQVSPELGFDEFIILILH